MTVREFLHGEYYWFTVKLPEEAQRAKRHEMLEKLRQILARSASDPLWMERWNLWSESNKRFLEFRHPGMSLSQSIRIFRYAGYPGWGTMIYWPGYRDSIGVPDEEMDPIYAFMDKTGITEGACTRFMQQMRQIRAYLEELPAY